MAVTVDGVTDVAERRRLLTTRGLRALVDGTVATVLPAYLLARGLTPTQVGAVVTATLLGSAAVTLTIGLRAGRVDRRQLLRIMSVLMVVTGLLFGTVTTFAALLVVAAIGTINPSGGDVSAFLPVEQALLPETAPAERRTHVFAMFSLVASVCAAFGALLAGLPGWIADQDWLSDLDALRGVFYAYAAVGALLLVLYAGLRPRPPAAVGPRGGHALHRSKAIVYRMSALFSLDAFGSGFAGQAIIVLWLQLRFGLSTATAGAVFFWAALLTASSALLAPRIAARIGLVRTMVYTHIPANLLLLLAAVAPTAPLAIGFLLGRAFLSQLDVPARTSYVMAVVDPDERTAAATVTNVPRSLASALPPLAAGWMLDHSTYGWPLLAAGILKTTYDLLFLLLFRDVRPPEEQVVVPPEEGALGTGGR
ncbi:MAG: MFS transporter [Acidimicrobiales bacterium]